MESIQHATTADRLFIVSKSQAFLKYMLTSSPTSYAVSAVKVASISTFLSSFNNFPQMNVLFRAQDFPSYANDLIIHSPSYLFDATKYLGYGDYLSPLNLDEFVSYVVPRVAEISIFEVYIKTSVDFFPLSRRRPNPLVTLSIPINDISIATVNSKNLLRSAGFTTPVSSRDNSILTSTPMLGRGGRHPHIPISNYPL